jgi:hypothetical protein
MRSTPRLALAVVLAGLLPASADAAQGQWSSPTTITAGGSSPLSGIAETFITADGRSLVLTSDGSTPLLAVGNASGAFGAPAAIGSPAADLAQFDGAVGPDGSFAVAWASGGVAHVALAPPGGSLGAPVDLPGTNATAVAVTIGPDNRPTVAFRTKDAPSGFSTLSTATAPPDSTAFAEPLALDTTRSVVDSMDVAAIAGGTVGVVYRKQAPGFRTYAAVYQAGALNYEQPQAVSAAADGDVAPQIVAGADGSFTAAWGNGASGPAYAVRGAGAGAFGAALPLNPAGGDVSPSVDLAATPTGGAAAAWAGGGAIRAATSPAGGTFGAPLAVDGYAGDIVPTPAVTVAPDKTLTVVANHPADGGVVATDAGGAAQVIGAGAAGTASPVAVASSTTRTVAAWRNAGGGISVATRSPTATPAPIKPNVVPGPVDKTGPKITRIGKVKRVLFHATPTVVRLKVRCNEACRVTATGRLSFSVPGTKRKTDRTIHRYPGKKTASAKTQTVTLHLGTKARRALAHAAKAGRGANAFIVVTASDTAGNTSKLNAQITLKPAEKKRHEKKAHV